MEIDDVIIIERPMSPEEKKERAELNKQEKAAKDKALVDARRAAYQEISDPVYMQWKRGLKTEQDWLDAVAQVEADYPIPGEGEE